MNEKALANTTVRVFFTLEDFIDYTLVYRRMHRFFVDTLGISEDTFQWIMNEVYESRWKNAAARTMKYPIVVE